MLMELLVGVLIFGALASALLPLRRGRVLARASETWPKVRGRITESDSEQPPRFGFPKLEYEYSVDGKLYHAATIAYGMPRDATMFRRELRCREGDVVWVFYDPANPAQAVLHPGGSAFRKLLAEPPVLLNLLFTGTLSVVFIILLLRDLLV